MTTSPGLPYVFVPRNDKSNKPQDVTIPIVKNKHRQKHGVTRTPHGPYKKKIHFPSRVNFINFRLILFSCNLWLSKLFFPNFYSTGKYSKFSPNLTFHWECTCHIDPFYENLTISGVNWTLNFFLNIFVEFICLWARRRVKGPLRWQEMERLRPVVVRNRRTHRRRLNDRPCSQLVLFWKLSRVSSRLRNKPDEHRYSDPTKIVINLLWLYQHGQLITRSHRPPILLEEQRNSPDRCGIDTQLVPRRIHLWEQNFVFLHIDTISLLAYSFFVDF